MKRSELTEILRKTYTSERGFGVVLGTEPGWENIPFVVPPPPPTELKEKLPAKLLVEAQRSLIRLPGFTDMSELDKLTNFLFVRREALQSSRMEGTWSTIDEVLTPDSATTDSKKNTESASVRGYAHSLEEYFNTASKKKESIFTKSLIESLHKKIVSKDPNFKGTPGLLRKPGIEASTVIIGGYHRKEDSIYNPTPPKYVAKCLQSVLKWLSNQEMAQRGDAGIGGMTLIVRLALSHSHFEAVHPFQDGNGRVGRALWPLQMVAAGYMPLYLSGYIEKEKNSYSKALQQAQKKLRYSLLIELISAAIINAEKEMEITQSSIKELPEIWKKRAKLRKHSAADKTINLLTKTPILSANTLKDEIGCSFQAATNALIQLDRAGVIRERTKQRRNRIFAAEEVIEILSREFGSDIKQALKRGERLVTLSSN